MNKSEFLEQLEQKISALPADETVKSLEFYSEMIDDSIEDGMTEEEAVESLGDIDKIVENIASELSFSSILKTKITKRRTKNLWLIITVALLGSPIWVSVAVALFAVILAIYISAWAVVAAFDVTAFALAVGGIAGVGMGIYTAVSSGAPTGLFVIGASLAAVGLAFIFVPVVKLSGEWLVRGTAFVIRKLKKNLFESEA